MNKHRRRIRIHESTQKKKNATKQTSPYRVAAARFLCHIHAFPPSPRKGHVQSLQVPLVGGQRLAADVVQSAETNNKQRKTTKHPSPQTAPENVSEKPLPKNKKQNQHRQKQQLHRHIQQRHKHCQKQQIPSASYNYISMLTIDMSDRR